MSIDDEDLTSLGKLFHNFGVHAESALSPKVVVLDNFGHPKKILVIGTQVPLILVRLNQFTETCWCNPFKTLYVRSSILNLIRLCMVSQ